MKCYYLLWVLCFLAPCTAPALVSISTAVGNTMAPTGTGGQPTDPGFNNVGVVNSSSGVYLGNQWVLTANHVANQTNQYAITLGGVTYTYDGTNNYKVPGADLRLFRLSTDPGLPSLSLSQTTPDTGSFLVMAGRGRTRADSLTTWYVDTDPVTAQGQPNWVWSESSFPEANGSIQGYKTGTNDRAVRWGTNLLAGTGTDSIGDYFTTTFSSGSDPSQTTYEGQAVTNDSGGAIFYEGENGWELAGIMVSVGLYPNQPSGAGSAIFGQVTYSVDLSSYYSEIMNVIAVPEPRLWAALSGLFALGLLVTRRRLRPFSD